MKRTVFIVGAGASANYGFPLGSELITRLQSINDIATRFGHMDTETQVELSNFRARLSNAIPPSIDVFLEDNPDLLDIGKRCIARVLMQCERHKNISAANSEDHWLKALWHDIKLPPAKFCNQPISFITYNYDRSLEHFLVHTLTSAYPNVSTADAWQSVRQLKCFHAHGQLAPYAPGIDESDEMTSGVVLIGGHSDDWDFEEREARSRAARKAKRKKLVPPGSRLFSSADVGDFEAESLAASGISLFWEPTSNQQNNRAGMAEVLSEAERIVFLGFGFLDANLDHLETMWPRERIFKGQCEVFGTSVRLPKKRRPRVLKLFSAPEGLIDANCSALIYEHVTLD